MTNNTIKDIKLWVNLTFKSTCYHRNFDMSVDNENIITEHSGIISAVRIKEKKAPAHVGEYEYSIWNLILGRRLKFNIKKLLKVYSDEIQYQVLGEQIKNNEINLTNYNKLVVIDRIILHPDYRKRGVSEEFTEFMYRNYYDSKTLIIVYIKPIQEELLDEEFYINHKHLAIKETISRLEPIKQILARDYYELDDLIVSDDSEFNLYKLYAVAARCGFERIGNSRLFIFNKQNTIKRLKKKFN